MKLIIFAVLLLIASIPNIADPENCIIGIIGTLIGIAIIIYKIAVSQKNAALERELQADRESYEREMREYEARRPFLEQQERERIQKSEAWHAVHNKWQVIIDEHTKLLNEIGVAYTIANNLNLPDSPQMQHVIDLCKKDIALAEMFIKSQLEIQGVRVANGWSKQKDVADVLPNFPTFKRLAIIYEKQKNYDEAIAVCQRAIELGFADDGTDGQMPGRIARLMRKKGKDAKKIEAAEEIVIDDSGEVIEVEE